jgi:hypothetical protein
LRFDFGLERNFEPWTSSLAAQLERTTTSTQIHNFASTKHLQPSHNFAVMKKLPTLAPTR